METTEARHSGGLGVWSYFRAQTKGGVTANAVKPSTSAQSAVQAVSLVGSPERLSTDFPKTTAHLTGSECTVITPSHALTNIV
jgi:hypothetical protein